MIRRFLFATTSLLLATSAHAVIIGGAVTDIAGAVSNDAFDQGGVFVELSLPFTPPNGPANTVGNNTFQTPNLYAFNEGQNITLGAGGLSVNQSSTGSNLLAAGTIVASHYVFFDPGPSTRQQGYVDFDADILGVITSTSLLAASDSLLNNNVTYLSPTARGLESNDSVSIGGTSEGNRLYVNWQASTPGDFVRVLTGFSSGGTDPCATNPPGVGGCPASVPEPSAPALIGLALLAWGSARRLVGRALRARC